MYSQQLSVIKQYREYTTPDHSSWEDYILEIFSVIGLQLTKVEPNYYYLSNIGDSSHSIALALILTPDQYKDRFRNDFGLEMELERSMKSTKLTWGVYTNGLVLHYYKMTKRGLMLSGNWPRFDEIILEENTQDFQTVIGMLKLMGKY